MLLALRVKPRGSMAQRYDSRINQERGECCTEEARDYRRNYEGSIAVDQREPEQHDYGGRRDMDDGESGCERQDEANGTDQSRCGCPGQARQPWFEDSFHSNFEPFHSRDQATKLLLGDAATINPRRKPRARSSKDHLCRHDHQGDCKKNAGAGWQRQHVDCSEDEQQAAPGARVQLRRQFGEGQSVRSLLVDDLREPLRKRQWLLLRLVDVSLQMGRAARLADETDSGLGFGEDRRGDVARAGGAVSENPIELCPIAAKLVQARPDRSDQLHQHVGKRRLEVAETLASKTSEDLFDRLARYRCIDANQVLRLWPSFQRIRIVRQ